MAIDLGKLQNGSDIRGVSIAGVPGEEVNLTESEASLIGKAFAYWLANKLRKRLTELRVCIGNDPRVSAGDLKRGLARGLCSVGAKVGDARLASTPAMFMSTVMPEFAYDGAIMITASHLPFNRNGFKFFTAEGGLDKEDITTILKAAGVFSDTPENYEMSEVNIMDAYAARLRDVIRKKGATSLEGLKIVVDAGNGAGGFFATEVLAKLGADVSDSIYLEPDGAFPNHLPNPENREAMEAISRQVAQARADLGIIFDTDVDRSAAVTGLGKPIGRNEIVALAAAIVAGDHPKGTVVTDSITSNELNEYLERKLGLKHFRYRRGYRNVINKAKELAAGGEDAFLAIETSGHAAYAENYYLDDGAYLACLVVAAAARLKGEGKGIEDMIEGLDAPAEAEEFRLKISDPEYVALGERILRTMPYLVEATNGRKIKYANLRKTYTVSLSLVEPNYEGVRVDYNVLGDIESYSGWFLLRQSLHDPVMPLNIESSDRNGVAMIIPLLRLFLKSFSGIESV